MDSLGLLQIEAQKLDGDAKADLSHVTAMMNVASATKMTLSPTTAPWPRFPATLINNFQILHSQEIQTHSYIIKQLF